MARRKRHNGAGGRRPGSTPAHWLMRERRMRVLEAERRAARERADADAKEREERRVEAMVLAEAERQGLQVERMPSRVEAARVLWRAGMSGKDADRAAKTIVAGMREGKVHVGRT